MAYCKVCDAEVDALEHEAEQMVIKMIKKGHPAWIEADGACKKCIDYYKSLEHKVKFS